MSAPAVLSPAASELREAVVFPAARTFLFGACIACSGLLMFSGLRAPQHLEHYDFLFSYYKLFTRLVTILTVGATMVWLHRGASARRFGVLAAPWAVFGGYALVSAAWSPLKTETLSQALSLISLIVLCLGFAALDRSAENLRRSLGGLTIGLILVCLFLLVTAIVLPQTDHLTRDGMGLGHSTNAGATAALGIVMLILCGLLWDWRWPRVLMVPGCLIFLAVIILAANRLSIAVTLGLSAAMLLALGTRRVIGRVMIAVGAGGIALLAVNPSLSAISQSLAYLRRDQSSEEIGSLSGRSVMWEAMWESFLEAPIRGHGYFVSSSTGEMHMWYFDANWTAHNLWLQVLVSTGIIGFLLFVAAIAVPTTTFFFHRATRPDTRPLRRLVAGVFLWYAAWGMLNESFMGPIQPESVLFFALLGLVIGRATERARSNEFHDEPEPPPPPPGGIVRRPR